MKKVALYGIGGLYNYGCEAIVRGTVANIRAINKNCKITYYSKFYEYDKEQIKDLEIEVVNIESRKNFLKKVVSKSIDILGINILPFNKREHNKIISDNDIIFSIGGDIYSIPKYMRDKSTYKYINNMVEFGELAKKKGKKVIIYGASIGPFGEYEKAKKYFSIHLKKIDLIVCRENYSLNYLKELGLNENLIFLPDPAYWIERNNKNSNCKTYIGVNLSALSIHEIYGSIDERTIKRLSELIEEINKKTGLSIMLIPHVYSPFDKFDNDYEFLNKIYENLPSNIKKYTKLVKPKSFIDVKRYLSECKLVVAARMHCAVNAITESIPTIFLSYSIKSKGMAEFIYGELNWFLNLNEIENELPNLILELNNKIDIITEELDETNKKINKYFSINNKEYTKLVNLLKDESE